VRRFRVRAQGPGQERVAFDAEDARHLARVLRLGEGDTVHAVDERGDALLVRLTRIAARGAEGEILSRVARVTESPLAVTLVQAIPKGDGLEDIIRMATELGVCRVVPLVTERTIPRVDPPRWTDRLARCRRVAREAAKQSGRAAVPEVEPPRGLDEWLAESRPPGLLLCCWEDERRSLSAALPAADVDRASVVVGPEGGLSEREVAALRAAGAVVAGLGPRILRVETAGPVAIALLQFRYGDLARA